MSAPARIEEEVQKLRGQPLPYLEALRASEEPVAAVAKAAGAAALQQAYASSPTSIRFVDTGVEAVIVARDPATQRVINRLWTRVKTGK